jgi:hypothetical protein
MVETPLAVRGRVTGASLVADTVTLADLAPMVVGVKVTEKLQGCPTPSVAGRVQLPGFNRNMAASVPERAMLVTSNGRRLAPLFVMVNTLGSEATFNATLPREADTGETLMA